MVTTFSRVRYWLTEWFSRTRAAGPSARKSLGQAIFARGRNVVTGCYCRGNEKLTGLFPNPRSLNWKLFLNIFMYSLVFFWFLNIKSSKELINKTKKKNVCIKIEFFFKEPFNKNEKETLCIKIQFFKWLKLKMWVP